MPRNNPQMRKELLEVTGEMLRECWPHDKIARALAAKGGIGRRQAWRYIARVYAEWESQHALHDPHARSKMREAFQQFYVAARKADEFHAAAMILDRLARLEGVYAPTRVEMTTPAGVVTGDPAKDGPELARLLSECPDIAAKMGVKVISAEPAADPAPVEAACVEAPTT